MCVISQKPCSKKFPQIVRTRETVEPAKRNTRFRLKLSLLMNVCDLPALVYMSAVSNPPSHTHTHTTQPLITSVNILYILSISHRQVSLSATFGYPEPRGLFWGESPLPSLPYAVSPRENYSFSSLWLDIPGLMCNPGLRRLAGWQRETQRMPGLLFFFLHTRLKSQNHPLSPTFCFKVMAGLVTVKTTNCCPSLQLRNKKKRQSPSVVIDSYTFVLSTKDGTK